MACHGMMSKEMIRLCTRDQVSGVNSNGVYFFISNNKTSVSPENLKIMTTFFRKIPPILPFPKGGKIPSLVRLGGRGEGRFSE
jgi:hypothetical protein